MTKQELQKFKKMLLKKKEALLKEIERIHKDTLSKSQRETTGELSGYTFHMADVASDNWDRDVSLGIATTEQRIIWEIDEAIGRINDKTYGNCQDCGKRIEKRRLSAIPYARLCVPCQSKEESKKKATSS